MPIGSMNCSTPNIFGKDGKPLSPMNEFRGKSIAATQLPGDSASPATGNNTNNRISSTFVPRATAPQESPSVVSDASGTISTLSMNSVVGRHQRANVGGEVGDASQFDFKHNDDHFKDKAKQILRILKDHEQDPGSEAILRNQLSLEMRLAFVKAVRFRAKLRKMLTDINLSSGPVDELVTDCEKLGLGNADQTNILIKADLKRKGGPTSKNLKIITETENDGSSQRSNVSSPMLIRPKVVDTEPSYASTAYQNAARGSDLPAYTSNSVSNKKNTRVAMTSPQFPVYNPGSNGPMFPSPTNNAQNLSHVVPPPPGYATNVQKNGNSPSRNIAPHLEANSSGMSYYTMQNNSPSGYTQDSVFRQTAPTTPERAEQQSKNNDADAKRTAKATRSATRLKRELKEAEQLLESSYSPQGEKFWHHQISDLKTKLRGIGADAGEDDKSKKAEKKNKHDDDSVSTLGSKPNVVDTSSKMNEQSQDNGDDNEVFYPVQAASERMTVVYMKKNDPKGAPDSAVRIKSKKSTKNGTEMQVGNSDRTVAKSTSGSRGSKERSDDKKIPLLETLDVPKAKVVAPAKLPEGYTFEARVGNKRFMATVPPGGVSKGEAFYTYMKELDKVEVIVPVGEWRDDLCDVCSFGPCHPVLLNSFFFPHISLGQIMGRSSLDYKGHEGTGFLPRQSCMALSVITYSMWAINTMLIGCVVYEYFMYNEYIPREALWIPFAVVNTIYIFFIWYAICSTRNTLRSRYMIPERRCYKCEDICCATFCAPCSIAQMNRHTGDFNTFRALCCSATGMPRHVAVPLNSDAKQVYDYAGPNMV